MTQSDVLKPTLTEQLFLLRRRKGWSRETAAKRIGVTARMVRSWEQGSSDPKLPVVIAAIEKLIERNT